MTEGYGVTPELLQQTAKGINDTIGELKKLGIDESGEIGRGFSQISLRGMQVGHEGLEKAFADFCERWSWGVRTMVQDGSQFAVMLNLSAGEYFDAEQYGIGVLKDVAGGAVGDPHKTDQQVENESWSDIRNQADPLNADYSAKSFEQLGDDVSRTWRTEARDLSEGPMGVNRYVEDAAGTRDQMEQERDQTFGSDTRGNAG